MIFRNKRVLWSSSDCTNGYEIEIVEDGTVKEFIDLVLTKDEWGYIGIYDEESIFGNPEIEYSKGKVRGVEKMRPYFDKRVARINARGGYSRMDYLLEIVEI